MLAPIDPRDESARQDLVELYRRDRFDHLYALADLAEPYWSRSRWWRRGDAAVGLVDLGDDGDHVVYAVSTADPDGSLALLVELSPHLPSCLVTGPLGAAEALRSAGRATVWGRTYHRYHWPLGRRGDAPPATVRRLGPADLAAITDLHATDPGAAFFVPAMLDDGAFVGVDDGDGGLVAVGGTHVRTPTEAAIGGVLVAPAARGRGLGRAVTLGVLATLHDDAEAAGLEPPTVGLNCTDRNEPAKRIYLELGFTPGLGYEECELA